MGFFYSLGMDFIQEKCDIVIFGCDLPAISLLAEQLDLDPVIDVEHFWVVVETVTSL